MCTGTDTYMLTHTMLSWKPVTVRMFSIYVTLTPFWSVYKRVKKHANFEICDRITLGSYSKMIYKKTKIIINDKHRNLAVNRLCFNR